MKNSITTKLALLLIILGVAYKPSLSAGSEMCGDHQCPESTEVTAIIGDPSVPGAIVCSDYDTVTMMIRLYRNYWENNMRASIMGADRERLLHGKPLPAPNIGRFGCTLLPPGTPMVWEGNWVPPVVKIKLSNGKAIRGVTDPSMIKIEAPLPSKSNLSNNTQGAQFTSPQAASLENSEEQSLPKASFDCAKAKSTTELLICNDSELSKLDNELAEIYRQAKAKAVDTHAFKQQNSAAWKWRETNCHDKECLVNWYAERKSVLLGLSTHSQIGPHTTE